MLYITLTQKENNVALVKSLLSPLSALDIEKIILCVNIHISAQYNKILTIETCLESC